MIIRVVLALFVSVGIFHPSERVVVVVVVAYPTSMMTTSSSRGYDPRHRRRRFPPSDHAPMIIGYAHDAKSGKAERAIRDGCDVIIWSFVHLELSSNVDDDDDAATTTTSSSSSSSTLGGYIRTDLDLDAVRELRNSHEHVIHLAAFGGWNGPHPPSSSSSSSSSSSMMKTMTGGRWFDVFDDFNIANGHIFDGVDWDYEGHDDDNSPTSRFTFETLVAIIDFSIKAKNTGYIVSMAPAESYLDPTIEYGSVDGIFSLDLDLPPRSYTHDRYGATDDDRELIRNVGFSHAGRQCYAYILSNAGIDTFDWISLQLYESYSPYAHDVNVSGISRDEAIMMRVRKFVDGYVVAGLPTKKDDNIDRKSSSSSSSSSYEYEVRVPPSKLVIGIANGWADGTKVCRVDPSSIGRAYERTLSEYGRGFLGVMFWTVEEEGSGDDAYDDEKRLARSLAREFKDLGKSSAGGEL